MRISHRHKFILFSSPKTGSESIRALLDPLSDVRDVPISRTTPAFPFYSHIRPIEMRAAFLRFGWPYDRYYRFVFVRNPWTRLVSLYRYALQTNLGLTLSFADWLKGTRPGGTGGGGPDDARWLKYGTYSLDAFAGDGSGRLLVNDVFRLEDIAEVPDRLRLRGIPLPADATVPWVNRSKEATSLAEYYTPELRDLVAERYAKEIERFGYTYPG
jgi:hypothetical protein